MQKRKFSRKFKPEAVRLVKGVAVAQAAGLDVNENVLRRRMRELSKDRLYAFPGHRQ